MLVGGVWTLLCALGGVRSLALLLVLVVALVLDMRCHQVGTCYRDKIVTVAATRYVAAVAVVACSCSCSCACISGKAVALAAEPLH